MFCFIAMFLPPTHLCHTLFCHWAIKSENLVCRNRQEKKRNKIEGTLFPRKVSASIISATSDFQVLTSRRWLCNLCERARRKTFYKCDRKSWMQMRCKSVARKGKWKESELVEDYQSRCLQGSTHEQILTLRAAQLSTALYNYRLLPSPFMFCCLSIVLGQSPLEGKW